VRKVNEKRGGHGRVQFSGNRILRTTFAQREVPFYQKTFPSWDWPLNLKPKRLEEKVEVEGAGKEETNTTRAVCGNEKLVGGKPEV